MRPYKTGENKIDGVLIALLDVDRLKRRLIDTEESLRSTEERAGDQLRQSESTIRTLLETASQAILAVDPGGRIVLANRMAEDMFGYSKQELLQRRIETLIPERLREHHIKDRQHFFKKPKTRPMGAGVDLFGRKKDGREFPVEVSLGHIQSDQEVLAVAFITDVSARKQAETALLKSHEKLRVLTGRCLQPGTGCSVDANDTAEKRVAAAGANCRKEIGSGRGENRRAGDEYSPDVPTFASRDLGRSGTIGRSESGMQGVLAVARDSYGLCLQPRSKVSSGQGCALSLSGCARKPAECCETLGRRQSTCRAPPHKERNPSED